MRPKENIKIRNTNKHALFILFFIKKSRTSFKAKIKKKKIVKNNIDIKRG